ncbi:MAG: adenylosuccinate lyase [Candidatus Colwellbacteria bacterium]
MTDIADVLAQRYASPEMLDIWSDETKIKLERELWIRVAERQRRYGLDISGFQTAAYRAVVDRVDLESIARRERESGHDVKARIEEFNALAGHQLIHLGMTSRDLTDNVEQIQILSALGLIHDKAVAVLDRIAKRAKEYASEPVVARTHNAPAQITTMGKKFANVGEELLVAVGLVEKIIELYPGRGLKGAVGTQQEQMDLLGLEEEDALRFDEELMSDFDFSELLENVGQVYPRSLDFMVVAALYQLASAPANFAKSLRLMTGVELVTEGFKEGRVGSTAMPHKMNASKSERIGALTKVLGGFLSMVEDLVGDQWQEGDVSDSVVRRVALKGAFFAIDGILDTTTTVIDGFGFYPAVARREIKKYLPFLATTRILAACVRAGMGREDAHAVIKHHAVAVALEMRRQGTDKNDLVQRLGSDSRIPLNAGAIGVLLRDPMDFIGTSVMGINSFCRQVAVCRRSFPNKVGYIPQEGV